MRAKDAMTTDVISVHAETTVREAVEILCRHRITGMPVANPEGQLVGIISESRLLEALFNSEEPGQPISRFMTRNVLTVDEHEPLEHVVMLSLLHRIRQVPVTRHSSMNGSLVGIINRLDLLRLVLEANQTAVDLAPLRESRNAASYGMGNRGPRI